MPPSRPVVFVAAVQRVGNPRRESERQDRVDRTHRLLVEGHAVDRFVFREPQADVHRGVGNRVDGHTVGSQHRHVTVGEDALHARAGEGAHAVTPLVFVDRFAAVDHREPLVAAREYRREDVALGQRVLPGAELHHVVPCREGQFAREVAVEGHLDAAAALHLLVARAVGHVAPDAHRAAHFGRRAPAQLLAEAFQLVEAGPVCSRGRCRVFRIPVARRSPC